MALEKLFFKLKKAAPPSSAVTALPFLEIGEAAPATVVLACVLALGDDELAWRLFGDDDDKEPRSAAEGKLRAALAASRSVGISASWLSDSPGGKQAVVDFCRGLGAAPLAPKSDVTFDAARSRLEINRVSQKPIDPSRRRSRNRSTTGGRRTPPSSRCTRSCRSGSGGAARPASGPPRARTRNWRGSSGRAWAWASAASPRSRRPGGNAIVTPKTRTRLDRRVHALGSTSPATNGEPSHTFQINYRKASNGGPRDALWLSCAFAPGGGFSVPVHRGRRSAARAGP